TELLGPDGRSVGIMPDGSWRRFVTIDPAGTSEERSREAKGATPSWTVAQVWDQPLGELAKFLVLRYQVGKRVGFDGLRAIVLDVSEQWQPEKIWIEGEKLGRATYDLLRDSVPIECISPGVKDKATRAGPLIVKLERGEIFLPRHNADWVA